MTFSSIKVFHIFKEVEKSRRLEERIERKCEVIESVTSRFL